MGRRRAAEQQEMAVSASPAQGEEIELPVSGRESALLTERTALLHTHRFQHREAVYTQNRPQAAWPRSAEKTDTHTHMGLTPGV